MPRRRRVGFDGGSVVAFESYKHGLHERFGLTLLPLSLILGLPGCLKPFDDVRSLGLTTGGGPSSVLLAFDPTAAENVLELRMRTLVKMPSTTTTV